MRLTFHSRARSRAHTHPRARPRAHERARMHFRQLRTFAEHLRDWALNDDDPADIAARVAEALPPALRRPLHALSAAEVSPHTLGRYRAQDELRHAASVLRSWWRCCPW